jgi:hypothetical protein
MIYYRYRGLDSLEHLFIDMNAAFKKAGKPPFTQATFALSSNGKFSVDFGYDDVSDIGLSSERRSEWVRHYLGDNAEINWADA